MQFRLGIPLKDAEEHLHDGPVKYFTDKMEKGFDVVEAYNLTVDEHLEPLPLDCAFGTVSAEGWPVRGFAVRGAAVNGLISCPSDTGMVSVLILKRTVLVLNTSEISRF